jgi:hypothetical protein
VPLFFTSMYLLAEWWVFVVVFKALCHFSRYSLYSKKVSGLLINPKVFSTLRNNLAPRDVDRCESRDTLPQVKAHSESKRSKPEPAFKMGRGCQGGAKSNYPKDHANKK